MADLPLNRIIQGDALGVARSLPDASVDCCLSSPPYFLLRNYGVDGQWGSEATIDDYLAHLWALYAEVFRVLKPTGTCFVNLGDTYQNDPGGQNGGDGTTLDYGRVRVSAKVMRANKDAGRQDRRGVSGVRRKSLMLMPERFAIGMVERGWILRNRICWTKPNAMPSSVRDRFACTWEYVWFFSKSERYWSDLDAVRVPHSSATIQRIMQATVHQQEGGQKQAAFAAATTVATRKPADVVKSLAAKYGNAPDQRGRLDGVEAGKPFCDRYFGQMAEKVDWRAVAQRNAERGLARPEGSRAGEGFEHVKTTRIGGDIPDEEARHPLGRNPGDTWVIPTQPAPFAHFAVWPEELARRIVRFGCPPDGVAWDPFAGSGTTALVALQEGRSFIASECNPDYIAIAEKRIARETGWAKRQPLPLEVSA